MMRLVVVLLVLASACGPKMPARAARAHLTIDVAAAVLYEVDAQVAARLQRQPMPCDQTCIEPYQRAAQGLRGARETLIAARHALNVAEAAGDANPGAVLSCVGAAVARVFRAAEAAGVRPSGQAVGMWQQYAATIGTICEMGVDPNARVYRGSAGGA